MASLVKRGKYWTARIYCGGTERWRSLGTTDRSEAEQKARTLERLAKGDQWLRRQLDTLLDRAQAELEPDEAPLLCESLTDHLLAFLAMTPADDRPALALKLSKRILEPQGRKLAIAKGWDTWLGSANRSNPKERTLRGYQSIWARFAAWADRKGLKSLHELDEAAALAYADDLWASQVTPATYNAHLQFLRSQWACLRVPAGLSDPNPWSTLKSKAAAPNTGRRALTPTEVRTVIGSAEGSLRRLLVAGLLTGARLSDLVAMKWTELDLEAETWTFSPLKTSRTGKTLTLPLLDPLLSDLKAEKAISLGNQVFPEEYVLWKRGDLTKRISKHFEACGIITQEALGEGKQGRKARVVVGFHSLRHTAATLAAKSGANLGLVQKTLGHSSSAMTTHYTHGDTESARKVLSPLAAVLNDPTVAP